MYPTQEGRLSIEAKGGEAEVIGFALALGHSFAEAAQEAGVEIPQTPEEMGKFTVGVFLHKYPNVAGSVFEKFKAAEVGTEPREVDTSDLKYLLSGLGIMESIQGLRFKSRLGMANMAGTNGRAAFLDHGPQAAKYRQQVRGAIKEIRKSLEQ